MFKIMILCRSIAQYGTAEALLFEIEKFETFSGQNKTQVQWKLEFKPTPIGCLVS